MNIFISGYILIKLLLDNLSSKKDTEDVEMCVVQDSESLQGKGLPSQTIDSLNGTDIPMETDQINQAAKKGLPCISSIGETVMKDEAESVVDSESESESSSSDENESTVQNERGKISKKTKIEKDTFSVASSTKEEEEK